MEDYVAADQRPLDKCLADVAACDLYLGIFAHRYGYVPKRDNPARRSITELEYRHAGALDIPRLAFLLDENTAWSPGQMDVFTGEGDRGARIRTLREELGRDRLASFFSTADELAQKVSVAVSLHLAADTADAVGPGRVTTLDLASYFKRLEQQYARLDLNALTPPQREEYLQILLRSVFVEQQVRAEPPPVELPKMTGELLRSRESCAARTAPPISAWPSCTGSARSTSASRPCRCSTSSLSGVTAWSRCSAILAQVNPPWPST